MNNKFDNADLARLAEECERLGRSNPDLCSLKETPLLLGSIPNEPLKQLLEVYYKSRYARHKIFATMANAAYQQGVATFWVGRKTIETLLINDANPESRKGIGGGELKLDLINLEKDQFIKILVRDKKFTIITIIHHKFCEIFDMDFGSDLRETQKNNVLIASKERKKAERRKKLRAKKKMSIDGMKNDKLKIERLTAGKLENVGNEKGDNRQPDHCRMDTGTCVSPTQVPGVASQLIAESIINDYPLKFNKIHQYSSRGGIDHEIDKAAYLTAYNQNNFTKFQTFESLEEAAKHKFLEVATMFEMEIWQYHEVGGDMEDRAKYVASYAKQFGYIFDVGLFHKIAKHRFAAMRPKDRHMKDFFNGVPGAYSEMIDRLSKESTKAFAMCYQLVSQNVA